MLLNSIMWIFSAEWGRTWIERQKVVQQQKESHRRAGSENWRAPQVAAGPAMTVSTPKHRFVCWLLGLQQAVGAEGWDSPVLLQCCRARPGEGCKVASSCRNEQTLMLSSSSVLISADHLSHAAALWVWRVRWSQSREAQPLLPRATWCAGGQQSWPGSVRGEKYVNTFKNLQPRVYVPILLLSACWELSGFPNSITSAEVKLLSLSAGEMNNPTGCGGYSFEKCFVHTLSATWALRFGWRAV